MAPHITDGILTAVQRAEALRRRRLVTRILMRVVPVAAGALLVTAALVRLTHAPLAVFWSALALAAAGVFVFAWLNGRAPAVTDAAAAKLDADAGLEGELRSAHWFASNTASDPWTAFHLERASDHVEAVSWPSVYPPVKGARAWAGSAVLALAAIAVVMSSAWPSAKGAAAGNPRGTVADKDTSGIPTDLQKQIDDLLRAIESGAMPMDAARAKLAEMRDALANLDPKTQAALAKAAAEQMKNAGKDSKEDAAKSLAERAEQAAAKPFLPQDMKWSMEDLASKLKYAGKPKDTTGEEDQTEKAASASGQKGNDAQANKEGDAGTQMTRTTSTDAQSSQMMASTMSPMPGEKGQNGAQQKKNAGAPLDLTGALRKETIEADTDSQGSNVLAEMRKKSEQQHSTLGFSRVAPLAAYDKSHATAPPRPADSVRPLVKQYFIRK
jgi:hypothetical protein